MRSTSVVEAQKKIIAFRVTSVFKPISCIEHDKHLISNSKEIVDIFYTRYAEVSSTESYALNFLAREHEVEHELDFKCQGHKTYNVPFTMKELQTTVRAADGNGRYSLQSYTSFVVCSTLLVFYNVLWTSGKYPEPWKEGSAFRF